MCAAAPTSAPAPRLRPCGARLAHGSVCRGGLRGSSVARLSASDGHLIRTPNVPTKKPGSHPAKTIRQGAEPRRAVRQGNGAIRDGQRERCGETSRKPHAAEQRPSRVGTNAGTDHGKSSGLTSGGLPGASPFIVDTRCPTCCHYRTPPGSSSNTAARDHGRVGLRAEEL